MRKWKAIVAAAAFLAVGCAHHSAPAPEAQNAVQDDGTAPPREPANLPKYVDLGFFNMTVPWGSVSGDDKFWAHVDEAAIGAQAHDLLAENGIRAGIGAMSDWPAYKESLDRARARAVQGHFLGLSATDQEIPVSDAIDEEHLFFFDRHGLTGRVYDDCKNLLVVAYGPAAGAAGGISVEISPVVRSEHRHYQAQRFDDVPTPEFTDQEQIFDLDLKLNLPEGKCLILAASPLSSRPMSLGHQFFTVDDLPGRQERVMIFVANPPPHVHAITLGPR